MALPRSYKIYSAPSAVATHSNTIKKKSFPSMCPSTSSISLGSRRLHAAHKCVHQQYVLSVTQSLLPALYGMLRKSFQVPICPRPSNHPCLRTEMDTNSLPTDHHLAFTPTSGVLPVDEQPPTTPNPTQAPDADQEIKDVTLKKVYHYLMDFSVMQLRKIARVWGRRQHGLKKAIVARIYVYILDRVQEDGLAIEQVLASNSNLHSFKSWEANMRVRVVWDKPPTRRELLSIIGNSQGNQEDPESEAVYDQSPGATPGKLPPDSGLTLSELARLLLLIRGSDQIKRAIFEARKEVMGEEETADGMRFWSTLVEPRFNDKSYMPLLEEDGPFEGIDARRMPTRYRSGNDLMCSFGAARQTFLVYLDRWVKEGRNGDPVSFAEVLPRNGRGGGISRAGKRSLLMFKIMKCWGENQEVLMLGLSPKFAGGPLVREPRTSGRGVQRKTAEEDDETDLDSEGRSTVRSKKRRRISGRAEDSPNVADYTKGFLDALRTWSDGKATGNKGREQSAREEEQQQRHARMRKLREQADLMKSMEEARRMVRENEGDEEFRKMAEMFYNELKAEFLSLSK